MKLNFKLLALLLALILALSAFVGCSPAGTADETSLSKERAWEVIAEHQVLQAQERCILKETRVHLWGNSVTWNVCHVTGLFPAVIEQTLGLVVGRIETVALLKEAVIVEHPTVGNPAEACREHDTLAAH